MEKPLAVVSCPIDTYSGYGARSRDLVKALIDLDKYDVKILSQRWGNTRTGYLKAHNESLLTTKIIPQLYAKPDLWVQVTVPNEFQNIGKYSIGVTAGMETTIVDPSWIEGCNRMDLVITSSNHSRDVFVSSGYEVKDKKTNQLTKTLKLEKPIEVLLEGADLTKYHITKSNIDLSDIKESFCFLNVGHWMQGRLGEDRKNMGYLVKSFLETFKNKQTKPALILKTLKSNSSIMDREAILDQIDSIRKTVKGSLPNIYLLHGEMSDSEINELYNHTKVKAMVSFTKGEGFGRPLLEFTLTKKPVIASGWSGHLDFLKKDSSVLIGGTLTKVDPSAAVKNMILTDASWFTPDDGQVAKAFKDMFKNYKKYLINSKRQGTYSANNFSYENMVTVLKEIDNKYIPVFPKKTQLNMPKLNLPKMQSKDTNNKVNLPKLKKANG